MKFSRYVAAAALALGAVGTASVAHARSDVHFSVGAHVAPGVHVGVSNAPVYYPRPVYVQPAPVYYAPPPVYYAPPPVVYVRPAPVYYGYGAAPVYYDRPHHWKGHKHHRHHGHGHHRNWN
jgi:hypothetical protein